MSDRDKGILDLARHIMESLENFSVLPIGSDQVHVTLPLDLYRQLEDGAIRAMGPLIRDAKAGQPAPPANSFLLGGIRFLGRS